MRSTLTIHEIYKKLKVKLYCNLINHNASISDWNFFYNKTNKKKV